MCISSLKNTAGDVMGTEIVRCLSKEQERGRLETLTEDLFMTNKSIFDDDSLIQCYLCGQYGPVEEHHVFGGPCRSISDRYGFVVHICRKCHSLIHDSEKGVDMKLQLHQEGQRIYEQRIGNRRAFIQDFIRSYL